MTYDFEVTASKYLHALDDGEVPLLLPVQRHLLHPRRDRASLSSRCPGTWRLRTGCRSRSGGNAWTSTFPAPAGCGSTGTRSPRSTRYKADARPDDWDAVVGPPAREPGSAMTVTSMQVARGRRRGALRGLPALPVPGHRGEEPGPLAVRGARAAGAADGGAGEDSAAAQMPEALLRRPGAAVTVHLRFLQLQQRRIERLEGDGFVDGARAAGRRRARGSPGTRRSRSSAADPRCRALTTDTLGPLSPKPARTSSELRTARAAWSPDAWCGDAGRVRGRVIGAAGAARRLVRLTVAVDNDAPTVGRTDRDAVLRQSLIGAHLLIEAPAARFVSLLDPPAEAREAAPSAAVSTAAGRCSSATRRATTTSCSARRSSCTTTRDRSGERGRAVRRHRDRRDPHPARADDDRRGEGRGPGHRSAGRRDHRPLRCA